MASIKEIGTIFGGAAALTSAFAYATTPALTGLAGAFAAAMIGTGTAAVAVPCIALGAALGTGLVRLFGGSRDSWGPLAALGLLGGLTGAVLATPPTYDYAQDTVLKNFIQQDSAAVPKAPAP